MAPVPIEDGARRRCYDTAVFLLWDYYARRLRAVSVIVTAVVKACQATWGSTYSFTGLPLYATEGFEVEWDTTGLAAYQNSSLSVGPVAPPDSGELARLRLRFPRSLTAPSLRGSVGMNGCGYGVSTEEGRPRNRPFPTS